MAFVAQDTRQLDALRPVLISRHSSCLPTAHLRPKSAKILSRRCRSASPPVKKRSGHVSELSRNTHLTDGLVVKSKKEQQPSTLAAAAGDVVNACEEENRYPVVSQRPIIRQMTSNYAVKQPKAIRQHVVGAKARSQMLCNHRNSLSMSSVLDRISFSQQHGDFGFLMSPNAALDQNRNHVKARKIKSGHKYAYSVSEDAAAAFDSVGCKVARKSFYSADVTSASLFDSSLPLECKLRIFSYLRHEEKGKCMLVSKEWYDLIRLPDLWQNVDLREFKLCSGSHADDDLDMDRCADDGEEMPIGGPVIRYTQCTQNCYVRYMNRIDSFISFLIDVRPRVKRLVFSFDLISDNWLATINRLIMFANLDELEYANMNWRDTPVKPYWLDQPEPALNDLLYKTRRRQRYFLNFFELFVQRAPNVMSLVLPFEWSPRSIKYLISLKKLRNLTIEKYFVLQRLDQEGLNALSRIKCLQRLVLEVWNPSSHDMMKYKLTSKTLRYLDMSQCRGLYLSQVDLPALQVFITERRPWNGPMTFVTQMSRAPINCLRDIMLSGARHLVRINDTRLEGDDSLMVSEHMSELWKRICPCRQHKSSLTM